MNTSDKVRLILLEEFVKAQARNPHYSMRAFSQKIGVAQSAISEILSGKRPVTRKSAQKILQGLDKDPNEISAVVEDHENGTTQKYQPIDLSAFHVVSEWQYYAILSLAETKDFESSEKWIAQRLGISEKLASDSIETLLRLDMLERDKKTAKLKPTGQHFEAISAVATQALRKANRNNLEMAQQALEKVPLELRDFTGITLCFDPSRMEDARKMIKTFRRNFTRVMESGHKKEVYKLSIQLFPLTKGETL